MEKQLTIDAAYKLCDELVNSSDYCIRKIKHLTDTLRIGNIIAPDENEALYCALLLHDVGTLLFQNSTNHAELGYQWLISKGITQPEILLPIRYHESDLDWKEKLRKDILFNSLSKLEKYNVVKYCMVVRDADIIANMEFMNSINIEPGIINASLLNKLFLNEIANKEDIHAQVDKILYILCGLSLVMRESSLSYLKKTKLVKALTKKLILAAGNSISVSDSEKLIAYLYNKGVWN